MILTVRTDRPEAEIGLYDDGTQLSYKKWQAGRELSLDIHRVIQQAVSDHKKSWRDIDGIIFYSGPGSFTGLRIGANVANTLAHELDAPIVKSSGENWIDQGLEELKQSPKARFVAPDYGRPARITLPRK